MSVIALMNPLQHYLKNFKGKIRWTPAHPEKRNSLSSNWSRNDRLKHVADKIATGNVEFDIDYQYELMELKAEDIMKDLLIPNGWSLQMKDGTNSIPAGIQHQIDTWRLTTYLQKRDDYRTELAIPRTPKM